MTRRQFSVFLLQFLSLALLEDNNHNGSTGGFCIFLGSNLISWSSKTQPTVSKSSTEAEYRSLSETASEIAWISHVLKELGVSITVTPELYGDNLSSVYLTANPAFHKRSKHFETDYHYVRERVALGALVVKHVPAQHQLADIFTKSLPISSFSSLRFKIGVDKIPASLSGGNNHNGSILGKPPAGLQLIKPTTEMPKPTVKSSSTPAGQQSATALRKDKIRGAIADKIRPLSTQAGLDPIATSNQFAALDSSEEI